MKIPLGLRSARRRRSSQPSPASSSQGRTLRRVLAAAVAAAVLVLGGVLATAVSGAPAQAASATLTGHTSAEHAAPLPCDIYASDDTPCVGAYSTVRALYDDYDGPLYQVTRISDGATLDIRPLRRGGIANVRPEDVFCADTTCTITEIFDQSPEHNNLTVEGAGSNGAADTGASAEALPIRLDGHTVYGVDFTGGVGYRDDNTTGVAKDGEPETMYMVTSSNGVNKGCCFDFGNAETDNADDGNGHMDAVSFSTRCVRFSPCYGTGPWVQADLENGLYQSNEGYSENTLNTGVDDPFVTALLKNNGQNYFALKVGNSQSGSLTTNYAGLLPTIQGGGYSPMQQEGAIVLGTGGDNSNADTGEFFEGVITAGLSTDTADAAVQASIVRAGYGK